MISVLLLFSFRLIFCFFNSYVYLSYKRKKTKTNIYPPEKVRIFLLQKDVILTSVRCMFFESTSSRLFCSRGRFFFSSFSPRKCRVNEKNTCKHEGLQTYLSFMDVACRRRWWFSINIGCLRCCEITLVIRWSDVFFSSNGFRRWKSCP